MAITKQAVANMNRITKLTYENGWIIGLGTCDKAYEVAEKVLKAVLINE